MQRPSSYRAWADQTPPGFVFAIKGPRFITHMLKLNNVEQPLANFFASGLLELGPKIGPILWQFPPQMRFDAQKFANFFDLLPRNIQQIEALARLHHPRFAHRVSLHPHPSLRPNRRLRHCVEIRDESFATPAFISLLRRHRIGLVVADTVAWPLLFDITADFVYCRLHGSEELYVSGYESAALDLWADRIAAWATGVCPPQDDRCAHATAAALRPRDVYVYFDNDARVRAPYDAIALQQKVAERLKPNIAAPSAS